MSSEVVFEDAKVLIVFEKPEVYQELSPCFSILQQLKITHYCVCLDFHDGQPKDDIFRGLDTLKNGHLASLSLRIVLLVKVSSQVAEEICQYTDLPVIYFDGRDEIAFINNRLPFATVSGDIRNVGLFIGRLL